MVTFESFSGVALDFLEGLSTPRSLTLAIMLRHEEFGQLVNLDIDPLHYNNADSFSRDASATSFLRKCQGLNTGIDTKRAALDSFFRAEEKCCLSNVRFSRHLNGGPFGDIDMRVHSFYGRVKSEISKILGPLPPNLLGRFGPGATLNDRGRFVTIPDKMSSRSTVTQGARCLLDLWYPNAWARARARDQSQIFDPLTVRGNRFTSVPKTAKTDRGIAVEPSINCFFQLGVGGVIRSRLRRYGLDINFAQDIHRQLACEASSQGHLATLDLSSASDTISYQLVRLLLPTDWFLLLDSLRSPTTEVEGRTIVLQKFSSMGNGFTFELETLLFWSLARCVARDLSLDVSAVRCFGDDLIIPVEMTRALTAVLAYSGFEVNLSKSFSSSAFRESCGGDFFNGVAVRGHFVKELPSQPQHYIALANGIRRLATRTGMFDESYRKAWLKVLSFLPARVRACRGPEALGDLLIHDAPNYWNVRVRNSIRYFKTYAPVSRAVPLTRWDEQVQLAAALYGVPSTGPIKRGSVSGYRERWASFS
jgi:hypothetical protein